MEAMTFELLSGGAARDEQVVHDLIGRLAGELGFRYHAYGIVTRLPLARRIISIKDGFPAGWIKQYLARKYYQIDPVLRKGLAGESCMVWSDALFSGAVPLWRDARLAGLRYGMSLAVWDRTGALGLYSLARDAGPISAHEQQRVNLHATRFMAAGHPLLVSMLRRRLAGLIDATLTPREREVVIWSADGKTAGEIAGILAISERTVNFHFGNVIRKLKASNKTQAIVWAVTSGMV